MAFIRAVLTLVLFALWTLLLLPIQMLVVRVDGRWAEVVPMLYHRGLAWLLRLDVIRLGDISHTRPTLFVANHVSWLDIVVLDTQVRHSFIAKHEVAGWPLFGLLAKLQRTVFIERKARRTADHRDEMVVRLEAGDNLTLFPEGTSSDGLRILPFKTPFFVLAERLVRGRPLTVQPVSIAYARLNRLPVGRRWMSIFAWVGDEDLVTHLWRYLTAGPAQVVVEFHPPVTIEQFASRKALAAHCRDVIAQATSEVHAGRRLSAPRPPAPVGPAAAASPTAAAAQS